MFRSETKCGPLYEYSITHFVCDVGFVQTHSAPYEDLTASSILLRLARLATSSGTGLKTTNGSWWIVHFGLKQRLELTIHQLPLVGFTKPL